MKKSILLLLFSVLLFSCSKTEIEKAPDPTLLKKIIKSPNTTYEVHWNFDDNGYLKEIVQKDGTVLYSFQFDANGNLLNSNCPSCDGYVFDPIKNEYGKILDQSIYSASGNYKKVIQFNSDGLLNYINSMNTRGEEADSPLEAPTGYMSTTQGLYLSNNSKKNVVRYGWADHFGSVFGYDDKVNPLKKSIIPIIKKYVFSITPSSEYNFVWNNFEFASTNNPSYLGEDTGASNPYDRSVRYYFLYNSLNYPKVQIWNNWEKDYNKGYVLKSTYIMSIYYYQGDIIP